MKTISSQNVGYFFQLASKDESLKSNISNVYSKYCSDKMDYLALRKVVKEKILPLAYEKNISFSVDEFFETLSEKFGVDENELECVSGGLKTNHVALGLLGTFVLSLGAGVGVISIDKKFDTKINVEKSIEKAKKEELVRKRIKNQDKLKKEKNLKNQEEKDYV